MCRRIAASDKRWRLQRLIDSQGRAAALIPDIVSERGWRGFRELEYEVCVKSTKAFAEAWTLIDAGGGVVDGFGRRRAGDVFERLVAGPLRTVG